MPDPSTRILFVDDDHITLTLLVAMARREECKHVEQAKNGHEALKKFLVLRPQIVFLDMEMPGMSGLETLRAIREYGIKAQFVIVSATATQERVNAAREAGASGFIVKPVSQKRIGDAIAACEKLLAQQGGDIELFVLD